MKRFRLDRRLARRMASVPLLTSLLALAACDSDLVKDLPPPEEPFVTAERESPLLAERVARGELPPLEERLPENPAVVDTYGPHAYYGGELRIIVDGYWAYGGMDNVISSRLVRHVPVLDEDGNIVVNEEGNAKMKLVGNLVESWAYSEDGTRIDMKLRKGLKYSDGHPFTTEDIAYRWALWNDTERYSELTLFPTVNLDGEPVELEVLDELRFRIILPKEDRQWLEQKANHLQFWEAPKHWLGQFDPTLNPEAENWHDFKRKLGRSMDVDRPVIGPWKIEQWEESGSMIARRNPYFYMTDKAGRQLPYIDVVRGRMSTQDDVSVMRVMNGQVDVWDKAPIHNLALLKEGEKRGGYQVSLEGQGPGAYPGLMINYFTERPGLAELFRDVRFRRALSMGIDRDEINDIVFSGFGQPSNVSIGPWFMDRYATYDPEAAARLLQELDLVDRDGDGVLEYPDGRELVLVISTLDGVYANVSELVASHWRRLGIDAVVNNVHANAYSMMRKNRTYDLLTASNGGFGLLNFDAQAWSPFSKSLDLEREEGKGEYEPFHRYYLSDGEQGEPAPPQMQADLERLAELALEVRQAGDEETVETLAREMSEIWADQIFMLGIVGRVPSPLTVSHRILNVPEVPSVPPEGYWLRAGLYPYQLVIDPRSYESR